MENYFLDTNIFLRYFTKDDQRLFLECQALIEKVNRGEINACTSTLVISEIYFVLKSYFRYPKHDIIGIIGSVLKMQGLEVIDNYDLIYALEIFEKNKIKFVDCLISSIESIRTQKMFLVSFDKEFDKLKIKRITPREIESLRLSER